MDGDFRKRVMLNSSSSESSSRFALALVGLDHFQHRANVVLDRQSAKNRRFLRQITDTEPRALVHRQLRHIVTIEFDTAAIRLDKTGDHVEAGGFACAIRSENTDGFATPDIEADAVHDLARAEAFFDAMNGEITRVLRARRCTVGCCAAARRALARLFS